MREREGLAPTPKTKPRMKYIYVSLLVVAVVFSILTLDVSTGQKRAALYGNSRYLTSLGMLKVVAEYVKLLVFPIDLCAEHMVSIPKTIREPAVLVSLLIAAVIVVMAVVSFRKNRAVSFCILWFFITLLPVSNVIVPVGNMMAERYMYIPSVGFCLLLAFLIWRVGRERVAIALVSVLVISYSSLTIIRSRDWKDAFTLWTKTARQSPNSARAQLNLGIGCCRVGRSEDAVVHLLKAVAISPGWVKCHITLGHVYVQTGLLEEAKRAFETALRLDPSSAIAHINLGLVYELEGKGEEAIKEKKKAVVLEPDKAFFHYSLACVYEGQEKLREALYHYGQAVMLDSSNIQALTNLGCVYFKIGMFDEAKSCWRKVLEIAPDFKIAKDNLKQLEVMKGKR